VEAAFGITFDIQRPASQDKPLIEALSFALDPAYGGASALIDAIGALVFTMHCTVAYSRLQAISHVNPAQPRSSILV
jgi:hypothetical protein